MKGLYNGRCAKGEAKLNCANNYDSSEFPLWITEMSLNVTERVAIV